MGSERGQATVEWVGLVLLASLALGALAAALPAPDGRSLGGLIAHRITCSVKGDCSSADGALADTYGPGDADLLRTHAPGLVYEPGERQLPVDFRRCRTAACAEAPDDRDLDAHTTDAGHPATAFTRVVRRDGETFLQYWFYYPDSNSSVLGSDTIWNNSPLALAGDYPGFHRDDWEGFQVRLGRRGRARVRTTTHGGWQWCKHSGCEGIWGPHHGWTRVSRGSHSGHVPTRRWNDLERHLPHERTSTPDGLVLVPLESLERARRRYRRLDDGISPPWEKDAYENPLSDES